MAATLNGQALFDSDSIKFEIHSIERDSIERSVPGLDGVLAIDLGQRGRVIKQAGSIRARGKGELDSRLGEIKDLMDGYAYPLVTNEGELYEDVRIDAFRTMNSRTSGTGLVIDYEIVYTQLLAG